MTDAPPLIPADIQQAITNSLNNVVPNNASSGSGAPASAPSVVNAVYVDTTNKRYYIAVGNSSASDWKEVLISQ